MFAKNYYFCYNTSMNDENSQKSAHALPETNPNETVNTSNIQNDEDLHEKISEVQNNSQSSSQKERFAELEKTIHEFLKKQDSDNTLRIITK